MNDKALLAVRSEREIATIVEHIQAVTLPDEPEPAPEKRSCLWMPPETRRAFALAIHGRLAKFNEMARVLGAATGTPECVARMALNAVCLPGREVDLDDPNNDPPALEMAVMAMGLDPAVGQWSAATTH